MKRLHRPTDGEIHRFLKIAQSQRPVFEIPPENVPQGFIEDCMSRELGVGKIIYERAIRAIRQWRMFPSAMATVVPQTSEIRLGNTVAMLFRAGPLWTVNPAAIVQTHEISSADGECFGFTYSTLPGHLESGFERFLVAWDHSTDIVTYSIRAVSRPQWWPVWLVLPYARHQQARFRRLSGDAMLEAVCD